MGKVLSIMTRPIRNYNVERRAHKVISKEKPIPAPQYEASIKQLQMSKELDPEFMDKQKKKNTKLDAHLKRVFVLSDDPVSDLSNRSDPRKPLPTTRKSFEFTDFNLYQVQNVREGRCSVQQVQTFLTNNMDDPKKYNATSISEQYQLDKKVVENLLEYYKVFRILSADDLKRIKDENEPQQKLEG